MQAVTLDWDVMHVNAKKKNPGVPESFHDFIRAMQDVIYYGKFPPRWITPEMVKEALKLDERANALVQAFGPATDEERIKLKEEIDNAYEEFIALRKADPVDEKAVSANKERMRMALKAAGVKV